MSPLIYNPGRAERTSPCGGFSLIEVMIAMSLLMLSVLSISLVFLQVSRLAGDNRNSSFLSIASRNIVARLRAEKFENLTKEFGADSDKNQFTCSSNGTITFGGGTGVVTGSIQFYNIESAIPESFAGLAPSFDLNSNGTIESQAITDYLILPARIALNLDENSGGRSTSFDIIFSKKRS